MRQLVYQVCYTRFHVSFYLWLIGSVLKHCKVPKYYDQDCRFNGVFSRYNLANKIKDGVYVINLDEYADTGIHWITLFCTKIEVVYCDSFGVEHVPKEIEKFIEHKNIKTITFRIQSNNSKMCGYFCIGFIDFMFVGKTFIDYTSLFSPYDFEKNDSIILRYF